MLADYTDRGTAIYREVGDVIHLCRFQQVLRNFEGVGSIMRLSPSFAALGAWSKECVCHILVYTFPDLHQQGGQGLTWETAEGSSHPQIVYMCPLQCG